MRTIRNVAILATLLVVAYICRASAGRSLRALSATETEDPVTVAGDFTDTAKPAAADSDTRGKMQFISSLKTGAIGEGASHALRRLHNVALSTLSYVGRHLSGDCRARCQAVCAAAPGLAMM